MISPPGEQVAPEWYDRLGIMGAMVQLVCLMLSAPEQGSEPQAVMQRGLERRAGAAV
jgi:hypothetical protein